MENYNQVPDQNQEVVSIGSWLITLILICLPLIGLIMLCIWAFGGGTPPSKANFAKAMLILYAIGIVFGMLFWGTFAAALMSAF